MACSAYPSTNTRPTERTFIIGWQEGSIIDSPVHQRLTATLSQVAKEARDLAVLSITGLVEGSPAWGVLACASVVLTQLDQRDQPRFFISNREGVPYGATVSGAGYCGLKRQVLSLCDGRLMGCREGMLESSVVLLPGL